MSRQKKTSLCRVPPLNEEPFAPSTSAPLRCTMRPHFANTEVPLHSHAWVQMVFSSRGAVRVSTGNAAYTVPPWRAVWIPARMPHTATVLEDAHLHSLHVLWPPPDRQAPESAWLSCRVIEVRPLLRELVMALAEDDVQRHHSPRYASLCALATLEIRNAPTLPLGITLPEERRLRALCESFLAQPRLDRSLAQLAAQTGASVSTVHRLFQSELGSHFSEWRKQALLAHALALAAKGMTIGEIAFELGYSSPSAFSSMVTRLMGMPPGKLLQMRADGHH